MDSRHTPAFTKFSESNKRDGRDVEYVMCALLHVIGDSLAPDNHEALAAAVIKFYMTKFHLI